MIHSPFLVKLDSKEDRPFTLSSKIYLRDYRKKEKEFIV